MAGVPEYFNVTSKLWAGMFIYSDSDPVFCLTQSKLVPMAHYIIWTMSPVMVLE